MCVYAILDTMYMYIYIYIYMCESGSSNLDSFRDGRQEGTAGEAGTSLEVIYSYGPPHMDDQLDQLQHSSAM